MIEMPDGYRINEKFDQGNFINKEAVQTKSIYMW